jgi:hypothetical protein
MMMMMSMITGTMKILTISTSVLAAVLVSVDYNRRVQEAGHHYLRHGIRVITPVESLDWWYLL